MSDYLRSRELSRPEQSLVLVSDIQERFMPVLEGATEFVARCRLALAGAQLLEVPIIGTEQYPRGLGKTIPEIAEFLIDPPSKLRFSCVEALNLPAVGEREDGRDRVVLLGLEAHVCVLQTAFDLQALGYQVILPVDAIRSQNAEDCQVALRRMENAGMTLTTVQSLLFEWCETAEHPQFKALSRLVTGRTS